MSQGYQEQQERSVVDSSDVEAQPTLTQLSNSAIVELLISGEGPPEQLLGTMDMGRISACLAGICLFTVNVVQSILSVPSWRDLC